MLNFIRNSEKEAVCYFIIISKESLEINRDWIDKRWNRQKMTEGKLCWVVSEVGVPIELNGNTTEGRVPTIELMRNTTEGEVSTIELIGSTSRGEVSTI